MYVTIFSCIQYTLLLDKMAPVALCLLATIVDKKRTHRNGKNILSKLEVKQFCNYMYFMLHIEWTKISDEGIPKTSYIGCTGEDKMINFPELLNAIQL